MTTNIMNFNKLSVLFLTLVLTPAFAQAQVVDEDYYELFDMMIMGQYEDCLEESLKYTEKDKTDDDPEPYIFASQAYLKLSQSDDPEIQEYYDRAFKNALKYAYKFSKEAEDAEEDAYEDEGLVVDYFGPYEKYMTELTNEAVELASYYFFENKYRKTGYYLRKIRKYDEHNAVIQYMVGMAQILNRNTGEGKRNLEQAAELLDPEDVPAKEDLEDYPAYVLMKDMMRKYEEYLSEEGDEDDIELAAMNAAVAKDLFGDHNDMAAVYSDYTN
jgi:hypothetical protein